MFTPRSTRATAPEVPVAVPLLTRLNQRGLRLLQVADAVALYGLMVLINIGRFGLRWPDYPLSHYVVGFAGATAIHLVVFYFGGLYERELRLGYRPRLPRIFALSSIAVLLCGAAALMTDRYLLPRANLVVLLLLGALVVATNRRIARWLRVQREGVPRVLLLGAPDEVNLARKHLLQERSRVEVVGEVGGVAALLPRIDATRATEVLVLSGRMLDDLYPEPLATLEARGVGVLQVVGPRESLLGLKSVRELGGMPFVALSSHVLPRSQLRLKRLLDLLCCAVLAPVLVPLAAAVALYTRVVAGPPLLYRQERVGQEGRTFLLYKLRTMYPDAEQETGPVMADRDDPRVIPGLRWVRAMRLDELPQLWNVLRGEMSLVGPRPERPALAERFEALVPGYHRRHEIPPGITGLAQVYGYYHTDVEYKLGHDMQYLVNWSPVMDLQVLLRTVWVVLARRH